MSYFTTMMTEGIRSGTACLLCRSQKVELAWSHVQVNWELYPSTTPSPRGLDFYSCRECGLLFKDPTVFQSFDQQKAHYLSHNNDPNDSRYLSFLLRVAGPVMKRLAPGAEGLDFGCGPTTAMAELFQRNGYSCGSYDPCFFPVAGALQRTYDFVTCSEVVEHFHDPASEFEKLVHLLKPGGWLAIMTQSPPVDLARWPYHLDVTHVVFYSKATFEWIAGKYGLETDFLPHGVTIFSA